MSTVPVSPVSQRTTSTQNALLAVGFGALVVIGSQPAYANDLYLRYAISSSNVAPVVELPSVPRTAAEQLVELHEASGLTWDQIARYFGVSRRAVHLWASGGRMTASNVELLAHLSRAVDGVRHLPVEDRRLALLGTDGGLNLVDTERARRSSRDTDINRSPEIGVATDEV